MMPFFGLYPPPRKPNLNISERITMTCADLESLLNQLEPEMVIKQHLSSLKQALFHSHTKVVQVAVKQFIRIANDKKYAEQLSEDLEVVLGMIENLAHKEQRVTRDCVTVLLLLTSTHKSLKNLLCPDITDVIKTIMTYVAVRLLVYEFILQLSINSPIGLEKSHSCGILEDVINDFKKKESYLTPIHYHQLQHLAATIHGRNHLVKYDALDCVCKQNSVIPRETMSHLITVIPINTSPYKDTDKEWSTEVNKPNKDHHKQKSCSSLRTVRHKSHSSASQPVLPYQSTTMNPLHLMDQIQQIPNSPSNIRDFGEISSNIDKCQTTLRDVNITSSSSSLSSPCDSLDSSIASRKLEDTKDLVSDSSSQPDRSFTPPLQSPSESGAEASTVVSL